MNDIPPIKMAGPVSGVAGTRSMPGPTRGAELAGGEDTVEISEAGQLLSTLEAEAGERADRIARIRQAIRDGTYETQDKIEATVERLMAVLKSLAEVKL